MAFWDSWFGNSGGGDAAASTSTGGEFDWFGALMSGISAYSSSREAEDQQERGGLISRENIQEQGNQSRLNTEYEMSLADWYKRKDKEDRRKGFSNFGQFATNTYNQTYTPPAVGAAPTARTFWEAQQTPNGG